MDGRNELAEVRERVDLVELVGAKVQLKRSGKTWKGLCPFHQEKTPSFYVYPESGNYVCFSCGEKGDAFGWVMKNEGVDFPEAVRQLADRAGVELRRGARGQPAPRADEHERLYALNALAATFYANILQRLPAGEAGRRYVESRGLTHETVERFGLGFAPEAWDALLRHLTARSCAPEELAVAGLVTAREGGGYYDRFRNRLLFPIRDRQGRVTGFGGRALGDAPPKYLNTAQTPIFEKSSNLYAIDLAYDAIRKRDEAVIVEGYLDAIMAHQVGETNVVASMGTALTEAQVGLLRHVARRIVLALDSDAAGQLATLRGIETVRGALEYETVAVPTARALIRFERRLKQGEIRILTLPGGKDPDEFLRAHPAAWPELVRGAEPLLDYYLRSVTRSVEANDPRAKSEAVRQLVPLIRELPDTIQQHHYTVQLAGLLRLPDTIVADEVRRGGRAPAAGTGGGRAVTGRAQRPALTREQHLVALALSAPGIARELADDVRPGAFRDTTNRLLWEQIVARALADPAVKTEQILEELDEQLRQTASDLLATRAAGGRRPSLAETREARDTLRLLRQEAYDAQRVQLQHALSEAEDSETRQALALRLNALLEERRAFDPPPSPYFRDLRSGIEKP